MFNSVILATVGMFVSAWMVCWAGALGRPLIGELSNPDYVIPIILQRGLPFEVKLPEHPLDISKMSAEELNEELAKGYADLQAGHVMPVEQAFANLRKENRS